MICNIIVKNGSPFPRALRPISGKAVLDYLITDVLLQKEITRITLVVDAESLNIIRKHITNAFPNTSIQVVQIVPDGHEEDILTLEGSVYTSLKLVDFIRYFRQFKTITKAAYDKKEPKDIPFIITPKMNTQGEIHTYNCGTGFCEL